MGREEGGRFRMGNTCISVVDSCWYKAKPIKYCKVKKLKKKKSDSVQSLMRVWLFVTPWTATCQASLSITNSWSLLKLMSIYSVMPSNHLIFCHPLFSCLQSFPASGSFQMSCFFASGGQSIGVSASASVVPMNIQDWGWDICMCERDVNLNGLI